LGQVLAFASLLLPQAWGEGPAIRSLPVPFEWSARIGGIAFDANDLVAAVVAVALLAAVAVLLRLTDTGTAVRAASERGDLAMVLGIPVRRLEAQVWILAAVLSYASVVLTAGVAALPFGLGLGLTVLLRGLTALVLGRMTDLVAISLSAVAVGVLEAGVRWNTGDELLVAPILAGLIVTSLLLQRRGEGRSTRDEASTWRASADVRPVPAVLARLPEVRAARRGMAVVVGAVAMLGPLALGTNGQLKAGVVLVFATVGASVVVLTGWAGQVSLGQMSFVGAGAAVGAVVMAEHGWDPFTAMLLAAVVGAAVAVVVGLPALRLGGLHLAVTTLALALASSAWVFSNRIGDWIPEGSFARPALFGRIALDTPLRLYYLSLGVLAVALVLLRGVRRGRTGRVLVAVRDGELPAAAFGISPTRAKLTAFAVSGATAAVAGVVLVVHQGAFRPVTYEPSESVAVFVATVIGGIGSLTGAVLGALFQRGSLWLLPAPWSVLASGLGVLVVLSALPDGLGGALWRGRDRVLRWVARRRGLVVLALERRGGDEPEREPDLGSEPVTVGSER
jgi:branched-chain amino acid transport system permease protein